MAAHRMRRSKAAVEFTDSQAWAALSALDSYLNAASYDESIAMFGSAAAVQAAVNAADKIRDAFYR